MASESILHVVCVCINRIGTVRTRLNIGCRYSTPVRERPLHPTRGHFTPEPSQTQAPVTPATEPERRAGGSLTTTLRLRLLKIGARVVEKAARIRIHFTSACPDAALFRLLAGRLAAAGP